MIKKLWKLSLGKFILVKLEAASCARFLLAAGAGSSPLHLAVSDWQLAMEVTFTNVGFLEDKELGAACEVNLESVAIYAESLVRSSPTFVRSKIHTLNDEGQQSDLLLS